MILPKKINIVGIEYDVKYLKNPVNVDVNKEKCLDGQIDYRLVQISIHDSGNKSLMGETFIHEVVHGIFNAMGVDAIDENEDSPDFKVFCRNLYDTLERNNLLR